MNDDSLPVRSTPGAATLSFKDGLTGVANRRLFDIDYFSLGVGTVVLGRNVEQLAFIEQVDRLLYRAKERGRNRVEVGQVD